MSTPTIDMRALATFVFNGRTVFHHERFDAGTPEAVAMVRTGHAKAIDADDQARLVAEAGLPSRRRPNRGTFRAADPWRPWPGR